MLLFTTILWIHIFTGFTALISGSIAMIVQKGKRWHKAAGRLFYYHMLAVSCSALLLAILKSSSFLFHIGIFSLFMNYSGYRSIRNKGLHPSAFDYVVLAIGTINGLVMLSKWNVVLFIFGMINTSLAIGDIRTFYYLGKNKPLPKMQWVLRHIGMMVGTYIATFTAFLVVNMELTSLQWLPWLLPTFIGTPVIIYWSRKYSSRSKR